MRVKTTKRFTDLKENKVREIDDVFEVTEARFEDIKAYVVKEPIVKKVEPKKKETKKKAK